MAAASTLPHRRAWLLAVGTVILAGVLTGCQSTEQAMSGSELAAQRDSAASASRSPRQRPASPTSSNLAKKLNAGKGSQPSASHAQRSQRSSHSSESASHRGRGYSQIGSAAGMSRPARGSTALPSNSGSGRRVIYAKTAQRVWLVRADDSLERTYLVSGRMDQPDPGVYQVFSKARHAVSAVQPPATMQYMIRFTKGKQGNNIGFHDLPLMRSGGYEQTEAQLGQPLSAGCVRQSERDAAFLWRWAPVGTTVVVLG